MKPRSDPMDLLAEWTALSASLRDQSTAAIVEELVQKKLRTHPHYADSGGSARVTVYAAARAGEHVTACFIADFYLYCQTISGSDWAEHFVVVGRLTLERGREAVLAVALLEDRTVHLTEQEADRYDRDAIIASIRAEKLAALSAAPSRAPELWAESGGALSPDLRCPGCGSSNVGEDLGRATRHFTVVVCRDCDRSEEIDSLTAASRWK